jgi:hypothetical protein
VGSYKPKMKIKNQKAFIISLIAFVCLILTYTTSPYFIALAAIFSLWAWKELTN